MKLHTALAGSNEAPTKTADDWTSALHMEDFRLKYFSRVYGFMASQFAIIFGVNMLFATEAIKKSFQGKPVICYASIAVALLSYGALYVKKLNSPEKKMVCVLMQVQFTLILAFALAFVKPSFNWGSFSWASLLICICCIVIFIAYRYFSFEFHTYHGIKFIFRGILCFLAGLLMLWKVWNLEKEAPQEALNLYIQDNLDGFHIAAIVLLFFAWSTRRIVNSNAVIRYHLDNFIFGVTLIYTSPALNILYKPKQG
ncbi:hypothetical protein TYRP_016654 [Tyrophagus putrescentiae]|nr:hypothetical protein TYRP_016654 [Tyrophagus putrescentiae]